MTEFKNLLLALVALIAILFGGSMLIKPLNVEPATISFVGGMVVIVAAIFVVWMAFKINRKEED